MATFSPIKNNRIKGALICSLLGIVVLLLLGGPLANLSYDILFLLKPTSVPEEVVMIYMDDDSHRELDQPWFEAWDRSKHAELLDRLKELGAGAVVFDILFDITNNVAADRRLVDSVKTYGPVYVAGTMSPIIESGEEIGSKPTPPFDQLREVAKWGLVEAGSSDRIIRMQRKSQNSINSLAWVAANDLSTNKVDHPKSERWINYYGPPGTLRWLSYHQVFDPSSFGPDFLKGKVVFVGTMFGVGFTGGTGTDDFFTPYSKWTGRKSPGVEVVATAFLNLLRGESLHRLNAVAEFGMTAVLGLLIGFVLTGLSPLRSAIAGGASVVIVFLAFGLVTWTTRAWYPWMVVAMIQIPFGIFWCVITNTNRLQSEKRLLEKSLAEYQAPPKPSTVQFSVTSPISVVPGVSFVISVWAHLKEQRNEVLNRADENYSDTEITNLRKNKRRDPDETNMDIRLELPGITLSNHEDFITWHGEITRGCFLAMVPEDTKPGKNTGVATMFVDGLKVASMPFSVSVGDVSTDAQSVVSEQSTRRKVFVSYSSKDRDAVLARVQGMEKAMPDLDIFMDVHSLRSGQNWDEELHKAINSSDIFYLFWSKNAATSPEVEKEWQYALKMKGIDFIDPVPLQSPEDVPPPKELAEMHFNDWTLAFERAAVKSNEDKHKSDG